MESAEPYVPAPRWPVPGRHGHVLPAAGPCRVLGIFAHPDDETFCAGGTFARYAEQGAEIMVVSATRGQAGQIRDPAAANRRTLPAVREAELRLACDRLGVATVRCLDHVDGTLAEVELSALVDELAGVIDEFRPDVVFTFGPDGGYGHPDHIAISAATTAACRRAGVGHDPSRPLQGAPRLYYRHFPPTDLLLMERLAPWLTSRPNRFAGSAAFGHAVLLLAEAAGTLGHIRDHVEVRWFPPGSCVVEQGEAAGELFLILSGTAEAAHDGDDRRRLGVGESFGYGHPRAEVVAAGSLTCLVLSPARPTAFAGRGPGARPTGGGPPGSPAAGSSGRNVLSSDVSGQIMRKIGALSAYRSQFSLEPDMFPEFLLRDVFGREYFVAACADRPVPRSAARLTHSAAGGDPPTPVARAAAGVLATARSAAALTILAGEAGH